MFCEILNINHKPIGGLLVATIFVAIALYIVDPFTDTVFRGVYTSLTSQLRQQTGSLGGSPTSSLRATITSVGGRLVTVLVVLTAFIAVVTRYKITIWEFSWATVGGSLAAVYAISLAVGQVLNLDAIRLYLPMIVLLFPIGIVYLHRQNHPLAAYGLVFLFFTTQLVAVQPHLLYSDTSIGSLNHGHYTEPEHVAAETMSNYNTRTVIGYESELWLIIGESDYRQMTTPEWFRSCDEITYAWREQYQRDLGLERTSIESQYNTIYSAGTVSLSHCVKPPGMQRFSV